MFFPLFRKQQELRIPVILSLLLKGIITILITQETKAQIIPDSTLPNSSQTINNANQIILQGGTLKGSNLFHSFSQFSLPTNWEAFFNNPDMVTNIFSRVTGQSPSFIDGLIRANTSANLFFLNPNGIIFGPNASLDIGGSFFASTAQSIKFEDGNEFNAINPGSSPTLTVNLPIGLDFSQNPENIVVEGRGHDLSVQDPIFSPVINQQQSNGLTVKSGKTLSLIGGEIELIGGILRSQGGRIELGSVDKGFVALISTQQGWQSQFEQSSFNNISLTERALLDASGFKGGSIELQGHNISVEDGSAILIQNFGTEFSGNIDFRAKGTLQIKGTDLNGQFRSYVLSEAFDGRGGNITISANQLFVQEGGGIASKNYQRGQGGNLSIEAHKRMLVEDFSLLNPQIYSLVAAATFGLKKGGNVTINTQELTVDNAGSIGTVVFGDGDGGNLTVKASDIKIIGGSPILPFFSNLVSNNAGNGKSGQMNIQTEKLTISEGGVISSATASRGDAGQIFIEAEYILLEGKHPTFGDVSRITSATFRESETVRQIFRLPDIPTGSSGNIFINTKNLLINEGGIGVRNTGIGNAGNIIINAESLELNNAVGILASSFSGQGGNIELNSPIIKLTNGSSITATSGAEELSGTITIDSSNITLEKSQISASTERGEGGNVLVETQNLFLSSNSQITAATGGKGNGGNININANLILLLDESNISANAFEGDGGNINITSQGLFVSPDSSITASSQFGFDGEVNIDTNFFQADTADTGLPNTNLSIDQRVAQFCEEAQKKSRFTVEGRQGMIKSPENYTRPYDLTDLAPLGEVVGVEKLPDGRVRLLSCNRNRLSQGDSQEN
ncbi:filamentous hemagglutinin N-terminal domain-containing protein [Crocosphaera sp. Alani8]|uniref:filamentous hemagglutinin N-terminal domain-containing protein n=1 Tax=Crocosphaera sp. Alani8 TaxID=3038952 RepID=UPI00313D2BC5